MLKGQDVIGVLPSRLDLAQCQEKGPDIKLHPKGQTFSLKTESGTWFG